MVLALRARALGAASLAVAGLAWALWAGCGGSSSVGGAGGAGGAPDARAEADAGPDSPSESSATDALASDAHPPYPGAAACPSWPGWYASPNMPAGCFLVCIPDDVKARVSALQWQARDDWCPGCRWLVPSWWPGATPQNSAPTDMGIQALGAGPDLVELGLREPDKSEIVGVWDTAGQPVFGMRAVQPGFSDCGYGALSMGQDGVTLGAWYRNGILSQQRWLLRPMNRAGELMLATKPSYAYAQSFVGNDNPNESWFTSKYIVERFPGFMDLVDVKQQTAVKINQLPGAPSGEYDEAVISGDTVFVLRFTNKSDWFVFRNGAFQSFLGGPGVTIDWLVTDGQWLVWNEGTNLIVDPADPGRLIAQRHDLYRAPFTTDPSTLQRQLLVPDTHTLYGPPTLANGHFAGIFYTDEDSGAAVHSDAFVVEVETGRAWVSDLPQNYVWGYRPYPTATELWGTISPDRNVNGYGYTVARVPYTDMTEIQAAMP